MKLLLVLAVVACAQALPAPLDEEALQTPLVEGDLPTLLDDEALLDEETQNVTLSAENGARNMGFASHGGGTVGGAGGTVWNVYDPWALRDAVSGDARRIIYVHGFIDLGRMYSSSPGVIIDVGSRKTIIGVRATIYQGGLRIKRNSQVIIQNIKFHNAISLAPGETLNGSGGINGQRPGDFTDIDAILCEEAQYVWIDHCEFADDPWISDTVPNGRMRHDGLVDIKRGSNWITVSNSIFRNHNKCMLIGHSDSNGSQDRGKLKTSLVGNWFMGTKQRNPRVRYGEIHVLNNLYTAVGTYGIGVGAGSSIFAERNVFHNSRAWRHIDSRPNPMGNLYNLRNTLTNSNYDAVPSNVSWEPSNYFRYQSLPIGDVEAHVRRTAGVWD